MTRNERKRLRSYVIPAERSRTAMPETVIVWPPKPTPGTSGSRRLWRKQHSAELRQHARLHASASRAAYTAPTAPAHELLAALGRNA